MNHIDYFKCDINGIKQNGKNITSEEYDKIMKGKEESRRITGAAILTFVILCFLCPILFLCLYINDFKILIFTTVIILAQLFKRKNDKEVFNNLMFLSFNQNTI
jgi:hypothetical protein